MPIDKTRMRSNEPANTWKRRVKIGLLAYIVTMIIIICLEIYMSIFKSDLGFMKIRSASGLKNKNDKNRRNKKFRMIGYKLDGLENKDNHTNDNINKDNSTNKDKITYRTKNIMNLSAANSETHASISESTNTKKEGEYIQIENPQSHLKLSSKIEDQKESLNKICPIKETQNNTDEQNEKPNNSSADLVMLEETDGYNDSTHEVTEGDLHPIGIINNQNMCFANAAIQCLFSSSRICNFFLGIDKKYTFSVKMKNILLEYIDLQPQPHDPQVEESNFLVKLVKQVFFQNPSPRKECLNPKGELNKILTYIGIRENEGSSTMEDSLEFIEKLFDKISEETGELRFFNVEILVLNKCESCNEYKPINWFNQISIKVQNNAPNLSQALHEFYLSEEDYTQNCDHQLQNNQEDGMIIGNTPDLLFIQICRYEGCENNINLRSFYIDPNLALKGVQYELIAYINFYPGIVPHYIAVVRRNETWYECNDSFIRAIPTTNEVFSSCNCVLALYEII